MRGREAFQEVDYRAAFGPLAKWATEIDDADRIPEIVARAFAMALSGRPGPVVVALPEDMLSGADRRRARAGGAGAEAGAGGRRGRRRSSRLLAAAERPLIIAGGGGWGEAGRAGLRAFAEAAAIPVRRRLPLPGPDRQRQPGLRRRRRARQGARTSGRCCAEADVDPRGRHDLRRDPHRRLHALRHPADGRAADPRPRLRRRAQPRLHRRPAGAGASRPADAGARRPSRLPPSPARAERLAAAHAAWLASLATPPQPGELDMGEVVRHLRGGAAARTRS